MMVKCLGSMIIAKRN